VGAFRKVTADVINLATVGVEGSFTRTIASGDHLAGAYTGSFAFGATPGTMSWVPDATITGGTGRFSNATGTFVFVAEAVYIIVSGVVHADCTETFDGTVIY
jgi:hypothetical protein